MSTDLLDPPADATTTPPPVDPAFAPRDPSALTIPRTAMTWEGFLDWMESDDFPELGRISFLGSTIEVDMIPERLGTHVTLKLELYRVLANLLLADDRGQLFVDGVRIRNAAAEVSHEPDAVFVGHAAFAAGRVVLVPTADGEDFIDLSGIPDLVIEVVSPSSVRKDTRTLRELYHRAGIPEYWLIDARGTGVEFQLLHHAAAGYAPAAADAEGFAASATFGRSFALTRVRGTSNIWQYTLHARPTA